MTELDARRQELKDRFIEARGYWSTEWDPVLALAPDFFEAYSELSSVPWKAGSLSPAVRELIYIAINASTTHLHESSLRAHIRNALGYGVTKEQVMEVYELTSVLGIHTLTVGVPVLLKVAGDAGKPVDLPALSAAQEQAKAEFIKNRGYWTDLWQTVLTLSPEYFRAYLNFSSIPWQTGTLEPKVRELIYVAITSATTHLFEPGIAVHALNALEHGATVDEVMEVFQLTSVLGIHTLTVGVPILMEELERAGVSLSGA
jgi:alkylhydroperoxidase/carboxymuconolactone decarboxylase family protein YurZ